MNSSEAQSKTLGYYLQLQFDQVQVKMLDFWGDFFFFFVDWDLLFGSLETLADVLPVDNVPYGLDVIRSHVLVLKVVGMLPNVDTKKRDETWGPETETVVGSLRHTG